MKEHKGIQYEELFIWEKCKLPLDEDRTYIKELIIAPIEIKLTLKLKLDSNSLNDEHLLIQLI